MPINLIIFDLDGTLIDSKADITNALNYALRLNGHLPLTVEETVKLIGDGATRLVEKAVGSALERQKIEKIRDEFLQRYDEHATELTKPYDGVIETLERLRAYRKVIVTNKPEGLAKKILRVLSMDGYFSAVLGPESVTNKKPSPEPLLKVMDMFGVQRAEAIMVGDSANDVESGRLAGIKTVAVLYGYGTRDSLNGADFILYDRIDGLLSVIN